MTEPRWPAEASIELLLAADVQVETYATAYDEIFGGLLGLSVLGDAFRAAWQSSRPQPNCDLTPMWTQTIRDLDTNPWTVCELADCDATAAGIHFRRPQP